MRIKWFSLVRITGLVLVLLYHFYQARFTGGFIGVDLFFTFSGYLITALFIDEFFNRQKIRLGAFYNRRLARIFPPLLLMVLVCLPFVFLVSNDYTTDLTNQVTSALSFTTNFFEIQTGSSYEAQFIPHLFVHTWSLAIEMQFYLFWVLILFILATFFRRKKASDKQKNSYFRAIVFLVSLLLAIISFSTMVISAKGLEEYSPVYFSTLSHSFPFFIGSLIASTNGIHNVPQKFTRKIQQKNAGIKALLTFIISLAFLIVLTLSLRFDSAYTYFFGLLFASILAGIMILSARTLHETTPNSSEPAVFTFLANISYGIYLFHWPLYVIFDNRYNHSLAVILTVVLSVIFASFSYYFLEPALLGKKHLRLGKKKVDSDKLVSIAGMIAIPLVAITIFLSYQAPNMSALEQNLWLGALQQDADQLQNTRAQIERAKADEYSLPQGVSIIGDSVTLGARDYLLEHIPDSTVDAQINRTMTLGYNIVMEQQETDQLREYVVIALGTNPIADYQEETMKIVEGLDKGHRLIFVTPYSNGSDTQELSFQQVLFDRELAQQYDFITVADWNAVASVHPEAFAGTDGTHFTGVQAGNELFTDCILQALAEAKEKPPKE